MLTYNNSLPTLRDDEHFFNEVFSDFFKGKKSLNNHLNCDIQELDGHYLLTMDMPGVSKEDIKIEVKADRLTVSAVKKEAHTEEKDSFIRRERTFGSFSRSFTLSEGIDSENIEASYENGVLHLAIAKKAEKQPKFIDIKSDKSSLFSKLTGKK